jgi:hypothetical protein
MIHYFTLKAPREFTDKELAGGVQFSYEPGNGTHFEIVLLTAYGGTLVAIPNLHVSHIFSSLRHQPGYIGEKLRLMPGDAEVIAAMLAGVYNN